MAKKKLCWSQQLMVNKKRREKYHLLKYGNLKKLAAKEDKLQSKMDERSMQTEMDECE